MMSNSKLTRSQKAELKEFKRQNPDVAFVGYGFATVLVNRTSATMGEFTTSVASRDEKKIRRKVGEYHAMSRFQYSMAQPVFLGHATPYEMAINLAEFLADSF